jgi:hypothetical protein
VVKPEVKHSRDKRREAAKISTFEIRIGLRKATQKNINTEIGKKVKVDSMFEKKNTHKNI